MHFSIYSRVMKRIAVLGLAISILSYKVTSIDEMNAYVTGMAEFKCDFKNNQNISSSELIYSWEKQLRKDSDPVTVAELYRGKRKYDHVTESYKNRNMKFMQNGDLCMYNITMEDKGIYYCRVRNINGVSGMKMVHEKGYEHKVQANYSVPEISNGSFQELDVESVVNFHCSSGDGSPQPRGILWMVADYNGTQYYPIICTVQLSPSCAIKETAETFNISSNFTLTVKSSINISCTVMAHHNFSSEVLQIELKPEVTIPREENNNLIYIVPCIILIVFFILATVIYCFHKKSKKTSRSIPLQNGQNPTTTVPNNDVTQQEEAASFIQKREETS
ncbi:T-lymphocyte activation antigen CD86 [Ranitomeya imitator]|uniref:T-lymphocyte activation antigen CD86 n=1 Tax=Ranitomeya imitator TaxID=111125 RepID=UPI0037E834DA